METERQVREAVLKLTSLLRVPAEIRSIEQIERGWLVRMDSPESTRLIGSGGETLRAFQHLVTMMVREGLEGGHRVTVDIGGYLERQEERLRYEATQAATQVLKTGEAKVLRAMSAAERRIVHLALQDHPEVESESTGEGRERRVVIKKRRSA